MELPYDNNNPQTVEVEIGQTYVIHIKDGLVIHNNFIRDFFMNAETDFKMPTTVTGIVVEVMSSYVVVTNFTFDFDDGSNVIPSYNMDQMPISRNFIDSIELENNTYILKGGKKHKKRKYTHRYRCRRKSRRCSRIRRR